MHGAQPVDYSLKRTGMNPLRDVHDMILLVQSLRKVKPDVTLAYFIKPVIYGTLAAWLAGVRRRFALIEGLGYVFTPPAGIEPVGRRLLRRAVVGLYRVALQRASRVFLLNDDDINEFLTRGLVHSAAVVKLGGIGVDLEQWRPAAPVVRPITFLLAARLLREKGITEFAEAARQVKARHPTVRFILLGGLDPNPGALSRAEVERWVAEGILEWPGHVEVRPWLEQASVYVLPSYYREGVPRSTQEAMAMARPVITTDAPGCRDTVIEGKNGFLVPIRDPAALAAAMLRFVECPELIVSMGQASRRLAVARFDVHKVNRMMIEAMGFSPATIDSPERVHAVPVKEAERGVIGEEV